MVNLREFRKANNLTQDELGSYLAMQKSYVSKIENGKEKLPEKKLKQLLNNSRGWDTTMLLDDVQISGDAIIQTNGRGNIGKIEGAAELIMFRRENEMLRQQIEELKAEKAEYWETIKRLTTLNHN